MRFFLLVFLLIQTPQAWSATKYVPANDAQPLIRRDLVPLDVDAIRDLANHLAILAEGPAPRLPAQMRHRAQTLTLCQRLSPAQPRARAIEEALLNGSTRPRPDGAKRKAAKSHLLKTAGWLAKLPAKSEGHRLGQLLLDIAEPIAAKDPVLELRDAAKAPQRWNGVVAKLVEFELNSKPEPPKVPEKPAAPENNSAKYAVTALLTEIPMFTVGLDEDDKPTAGLITTSLVITTADAAPEPEKPDDGGGEDQPSTRGTLRFQPDTGFNIKPLHRALINFFKTNSTPLPVGYNLNINTNKRRYLDKNRENIAAPIAMMLDAAVSGRPLRRNTILFARLRADGTLEKPAGAWELLLKLDELKLPSNSRIIVGANMMEELQALLVMEKAEFFTKYEVLLASTFEEARTLFYNDGTPDSGLRGSMKGYEEVRSKAREANNLATFLSLSAVETRLIAASKLSPRHLSAKMLATQAIRRPAYFSRYMFAQELDRRLEEISRFEYKIDKTPARAIKDAYKKARENLDPLSRRIERSEESILDEALDLIKELNTVGRGSSSFIDNEEFIRNRDMIRFQLKLKAFREKLRVIYQPAEKK